MHVCCVTENPSKKFKITTYIPSRDGLDTFYERTYIAVFNRNTNDSYVQVSSNTRK